MRIWSLSPGRRRALTSAAFGILATLTGLSSAHADSKGIVVESVNNFGGSGDLSNSIANGDGFVQGTVFPGSQFFLSARWTDDAAPSERIVWHRRWEIDLEQLRGLYAGNCRVRAWLQFGRVPHVADGRIADLRFEHPVGQNFTPMPVEVGTGCPSYVTRWIPPRSDVLLTAADLP